MHGRTTIEELRTNRLAAVIAGQRATFHATDAMTRLAPTSASGLDGLLRRAVELGYREPSRKVCRTPGHDAARMAPDHDIHRAEESP